MDKINYKKLMENTILARFIHDSYERWAQKTGWKTQNSCKVKYCDLPAKNRETMLLVAVDIRRYFDDEVKD